MPTPTLIRWDGLTIQVAPDGTLATVCLDGHTHPVLRDVGVVFGPGWQQRDANLLLDEVEQRFTYAPHGTALASAVVRQVFDSTWSLRVQVINLTDEPLTVPAVRLGMTSAWPMRRWLAGAEGSIAVTTDRDDQALLVFTQLRGHSRLSEGHTFLTDIPLQLGPGGGPAGIHQVAWRADWLRDERMQAASLPGWWPDRHVIAEGDIVELELPDAAIEAVGISILEDEATTVLTARPGHHMAHVHAARGTTDVELFWAPSLVEGRLMPSAHALVERDPRTLTAFEVFLLGRAHAARPMGERAEEQLADATLALADRCVASASTPPLALAAVADQVLRHGTPDLVDLLHPLAQGMALEPGALLCLVHASLAGRLVGAGPTLAWPRENHDLDPLARAVTQVEALTLDPPEHMPPAALRVATLLGAGLPGHSVDDLTLAKVWAITGMFPEGWDPGQRWPVSLGMARDIARDQLLAKQCDDQTLAWLLW